MVEPQLNKNKFVILDTLTLDVNCDCVSFCPLSGYEHLMLLGLYELNEATKSVAGGFILFDTSLNKLNNVYSWNEGGIYDIKWIDKKFVGCDKIFFMSVSLDSYIRIFSYEEKNKTQQANLEKAFSMKIEGKSDRVPLLYIDSLVANDSGLHCVTCTEDGSIIYLRMDSNLDIVERLDYNQHKYTAWCVNFLPSDNNIFLSGSDDMKLVVYDKRLTENGGVSLENRKSHTMGICCITFLDQNSSNFYTGSFDETIRLWDIRNLKEEVSSQRLDGGIWRIVLKDKSEVLTANFTTNTITVLERADNLPYKINGVFDQHSSLTYGLDMKKKSSICGSCSFYDKTVKLWDYSCI